MAVSSTIPRVQYTATAGQTAFTVPWKWFADEDIKAYSTAAGSEPLLPEDEMVLNVDYTLAGVGVDAGGTLTLVTAAELDQTITIERDSIGDRPETYDFEVAGTFTVEQLNKNFDKLSMGMQDNNMLIHNRMLLYPAVDTFTQGGDLILPKLENGYIWKKNDNGRLIAAELDENADCSTLRSELASESAAAPGTSIIGHYADQLASGEDLETFLNRVDLELREDLAVDTMADAGSKLVGHYDEETSTNTTVYTQLQDLAAREARIPFWGYRLSNSAVDADNDITVSAGACVERGGDTVIETSSAMTKKADVNWALGTGQGGMASAVTYAADSYYYVFKIMKADGTVDTGFDTSITATNLLSDAAGFVHYKRIGSFVTKSTGVIMRFYETSVAGVKTVMFNDLARRADAERELSVSNPPSGSPHVLSLKHAPHDIAINLFFLIKNNRANITGGSICEYELYSDLIPKQTGTTDVYLRGDSPFLVTLSNSGYESANHGYIYTNGSITLEGFGFSGTPDTNNYLYCWTMGWVDNLDMDEFV